MMKSANVFAIVFPGRFVNSRGDQRSLNVGDSMERNNLQLNQMGHGLIG